jgi:hypothetical protein
MTRFTVFALLVFFIDFVVADSSNVNEQEASLSHDVALLRQAVLTLQDTVRNQGVLITDLRQLNQQQEKRIQELEAVQKNWDEDRELQEYWLKYLESKFSSDMALSKDNERQHADKSTHHAMVKGEGTANEKINRRGWYTFKTSISTLDTNGVNLFSLERSKSKGKFTLMGFS